MAFLIVTLEWVTDRPSLAHVFRIAQLVNDRVEIVTAAMGPILMFDELLATDILPVLLLINARPFLKHPAIATNLGAVTDAVILAVLA